MPLSKIWIRLYEWYLAYGSGQRNRDKEKKLAGILDLYKTNHISYEFQLEHEKSKKQLCKQPIVVVSKLAPWHKKVEQHAGNGAGSVSTKVAKRAKIPVVIIK